MPQEIEELHGRGIDRIFSPEDGRKMGLKDLHHYDTYVPILSDIQKHHTWDAATDVVIDALLKLQKKIEKDRPVQLLLKDRRNDDEWLEGHGELHQQPNAAVPTYRPMHVLPAEPEEKDE